MSEPLSLKQKEDRKLPVFNILMISNKAIPGYFRKMQEIICSSLEKADGKAKFSTDKWKRKGGGGGITRVIQNGKVFEKGGVNFSEVYGECPDFIQGEFLTGKSRPEEFFATGLSIVIHPQSPMVPIIHMNVRYFELSFKNLPSGKPGSKSKIQNSCWFGGGIDLTPHYVSEEDAVFFHQSLKNICDKHDKMYYPEFKKWADDYFYIQHRDETRGIGGIFFDRLAPEEKKSKEQLFDFVRSVADIFLPVYLPLVEKNKKLLFGKKEKEWQLLRRGRYVEFNLVYDRGTRFGLETGGRTESILMSLPQEAKWIYNFIPRKNSHEEKTLKWLKKAVHWI